MSVLLEMAMMHGALHEEQEELRGELLTVFWLAVHSIT